MKKNVIALAVAAAMAAPLAAQAEVKVSGQLQAEIASFSGDNVTEGLYLTDAQEGGKPGSGNYGAINFSASEDLGGGLKALAKVGLNIDAAKPTKSAVITRDAYVGLSGGFGTVLAGSMSSPYKSSTVKWDPFLTTSAQARGNGGMSTLHNSYASDAVAYANKFGNAKVVAAIVLDETPDTGAVSPGTNETTGNHGISFSVNMPVGPVELALAYLDLSDYGASTLAPGTRANNDFTATKLGVKYAAGAIGVAFQYEMIEDGQGTGSTNTDDTDYMYANVTYAAGANTFALAYGQSETDDKVATTNDPTPTYMSLGVVHSFSKTTSVHAAYVAMDTDVSCRLPTSTNCGDDSGIAAGLRIKF